jgi:hypothetical protein
VGLIMLFDVQYMTLANDGTKGWGTDQVTRSKRVAEDRFHTVNDQRYARVIDNRGDVVLDGFNDGK